MQRKSVRIVHQRWTVAVSTAAGKVSGWTCDSAKSTVNKTTAMQSGQIRVMVGAVQMNSVQ